MSKETNKENLQTPEEAVETTEVTAEAEQASGWSEEEWETAQTHYDAFSKEAFEFAGSYGIPFSLYGFTLVFSVLAIIMVIVTVFGKIFGIKQDKPKVEKKPEKKPEPKKEAAPAPVAAAPVSDNGGVVAAIMAAISAYRAANGESAGGFRVVSFKKRK